MTSRFDYVKYDEHAQSLQEGLKRQFVRLHDDVDAIFANSDYKKEATKHLEIAYMMIDKAIRDDQIKRNGSAPLQEERTDS